MRCGARSGASRELGRPGRRACVYPPPSLSLCGCAGPSLAWADQMGRPSGPRTPPKYRFLAPPHCREQAGFLPFLLPACPLSQALPDWGRPRLPECRPLRIKGKSPDPSLPQRAAPGHRHPQTFTVRRWMLYNRGDIPPHSPLETEDCVVCWALGFSSGTSSTGTIICWVLPTCQVNVPLAWGPLIPAAPGPASCLSSCPGLTCAGAPHSPIAQPRTRQYWFSINTGSGMSVGHPPSLSPLPWCLRTAGGWLVDVPLFLDRGPQSQLHLGPVGCTAALTSVSTYRLPVDFSGFGTGE